MPLTPIPLSEEDYRVMNLTSSGFWNVLWMLPKEIQYFVINSTHRLAEVNWIIENLEKEVKRNSPPIVQQGLLSLQVYLLLTCADTLGHIGINKNAGVGERFRNFFKNLPQEAKHNLLENISTLKTDFSNLIILGLADEERNSVIYPSRQQIFQILSAKTEDEKFNAIVDFLYYRRNHYTHQSEYPQLGYHPNLAVMQNQRLGLPNVGSIGEYDQLEPIFEVGKKGNVFYYFTYYSETTGKDPIAVIRRSIILGIGKIMADCNNLLD